MKNKKANITLLSAADIKNGGFIASVRRGLNELRSLKRRKIISAPLPPMPERIKLSVIICTLGKSHILCDSLKAVLNQTAAADSYEVICVLNGNAAEPDKLPHGVRYITEPRCGLSYARNTGAAAAKGEILLYIDDDAVADSKLIESITGSFMLHKNTAVIGGQIYLDVPVPRPKILLSGREGLWTSYTVPYKAYREVHEQYSFPYGACFAIRKNALDELGSFPLSYGRVGENYAGGEETALCFMALKRGWKVGIEPSAIVTHRVAPERFCRRHVKNTIKSGIFTTYRLIKDGYANYTWDARYLSERVKICNIELEKLKRDGKRIEYFYKKCESDAFAELLKKEAENEAYKSI